MKNIFTESNRLKHLLFAIPVGFVFSILCVLGVASGMEFKDVAYDKASSGKSILNWSWKHWDWLDWFATMLGGLVGQAGQCLLIYLIYTNPY